MKFQMISNRYVNFILLFCYSALIFYLSSKPYLKPPAEFWSADKFYHFFEYGLYGMLMINFLKDFKLNRILILSIILGSLYAASDEIHQYFVPNRHASVIDWIFDVIGVYLGTKLYLYGGKRWLGLQL